MSKKPMQKFMDWLQYKVTPAVQKFTERPWVHGFSAGIVKCLPFILTGCLIFFYNVVQPYFPNGRNHSCTVLHRDVHRRYAWRNLVGCVPGSGSADLVSILQDLRKAGSREGGCRGSGKGINRKFDKIKRENTTYER